MRRGAAFREAHRIVGLLVAEAERAGIGLDALADQMVVDALRSSDDPAARRLADEEGVGEAVRSSASIDGALAASDVIGGTAPARVREALAAAKARLDRR